MAHAVPIPNFGDQRVLAFLRRYAAMKFVHVAAGDDEGVLATATLADAADDTLRVDARLPGEHANGWQIVTLRTTVASGGAPRFNLSLYDDADALLESWRNLSMDPAHPRYCVDFVNARSDRIRLTNLDSTTEESRPSDVALGDEVMASGAGEYAAPGIARGDCIMGAWNVTDGALVPLEEIEAPATDVCVTAVGGTTTDLKALLLLVVPA